MNPYLSNYGMAQQREHLDRLSVYFGEPHKVTLEDEGVGEAEWYVLTPKWAFDNLPHVYAGLGDPDEVEWYPVRSVCVWYGPVVARLWVPNVALPAPWQERAA